MAQNGSGKKNADGMMAALELVASSLEDDVERARFWYELGMATVAKIQSLTHTLPALHSLQGEAEKTQVKLRQLAARWNDNFHERGRKGASDA